ncbi:hypothetical protein GCM10023329_02390 [Streptomyces sanyensis]|uniref:Uncharacterized protein n=1 Tax=Streptomyces sanyensis TaxID=568869 RepID=A0ABP8ZML3_9ACTN
MFLIAASWSSPPPLPPTAEEKLRNALLQHDGSHGRLQHVRLHMSRGGARGVLFVSAQDSAAAESHVRALWAAVARSGGPVGGWRLLQCTPLPLGGARPPR